MERFPSIAIGYQDSHPILPESLRQKASMPRERKSLSDIAFLEELGNVGGISSSNMKEDNKPI